MASTSKCPSHVHNTVSDGKGREYHTVGDITTTRKQALLASKAGSLQIPDWNIDFRRAKENLVRKSVSPASLHAKPINRVEKGLYVLGINDGIVPFDRSCFVDGGVDTLSDREDPVSMTTTSDHRVFWGDGIPEMRGLDGSKRTKCDCEVN